MSRDSRGFTEGVSGGDQEAVAEQPQEGQSSWGNVEQLRDEESCKHLVTNNQSGLTEAEKKSKEADMWDQDGETLLTQSQTGQQHCQNPSDRQPLECAADLLQGSQDPGICVFGRSSTPWPTAPLSEEPREELIQAMVRSLTTKSETLSTPSNVCFHTAEPLACSLISMLTNSFLEQAPAGAEVPVRLSESLYLSASHTTGDDPEILLCNQTAAGPLADMRRLDQDLSGRNSCGMSLPSLWDRSGGGSRTCVLTLREDTLRTARLKPASAGAPHPPLLTRSAPSFIEPVLDSESLFRVRAHIYTRLGGGGPEATVITGQKGGMPFLPPRSVRTPRLLAPLDVGQREKPKLLESMHSVTLLSSTSASRERRQRWSRRGCPTFSVTRGGSEESGSSSISSQGSLDLEEERRFLAAPPDQPEGLGGTCSGSVDRHSYGLGSLSSVQSFIGDCHIAIPFLGSGDPVEDQTSNEQHAESNNGYGECSRRANTQSPDVPSYDTCQRNKKDRHINLPVYSGLDSEREAHGNPCNSKHLAQPTKEDLRSEECESVCKIPGRKSDSAKRTDEGQLVHSTLDCNQNLTKVNIKMSENEKHTGDCKIIKPPNKCYSMHHTNQSFNVLAHKEHNVCNRKPKSKLRNISIPSQLKVNTRRPDVINGKGMKLGLRRLNGTKTSEKNPQLSTIYHKLAEPLRGNRTQSNRSPTQSEGASQNQLQIDLRSARQPKRSGMVEILRAKSAMECVTYKDMFQKINSQEEGPAIYEMFATPVYENLRAPSSYDRLAQRDVKSAPPSKSQGLKNIKFPQPPENKLCKFQRKKSISANSKQRRKAGVSPRGKLRRSLASEADQENSVMTSDLNCHIQSIETEVVLSEDDGECESQVALHKLLENSVLSVIEEVLSSHPSETSIFQGTLNDETVLSADILSDTKLDLTVSYNKPVEKTTFTSTNLQDGTYQPLERRQLLQECDGKGLKGNEDMHMVVDRGNEEPHTFPEKPNLNSWTSGDSKQMVSPVFQKFLDVAGEGALTDDLLRCLAEELISLDERSMTTYSENCVLLKEETGGVSPVEKQVDVREGANGTLSSHSDDAIMWTKGEVLGRGAYGTVYCGLTSQGELIAVKQVAIDDSSPGTAEKEYQRLQDEVDLLKTLHHTNIVGFLGTSLQDNVVSIFMEYVPGGSIASVLLRFGPLPERVLSLYTRQVVEGVAYLHTNRIIHRDLKGNNIMLMPTGIIKLIDFGCARRISRLTQSMDRSELLKSVHGTPYWMAPEVINETGHGRKSDIWSIGCTVFEMATGKPPLAHMDKMAALFYIGARKGLMPTLPVGFSEEARNFVQACLISDPKERPSAKDLLTYPFVPR